MPSYPDWLEPLRILSRSVEPATAEQLAFAAKTGVNLAADESRDVAAVLIEDHLRPTIWGDAPEPATGRQRAFLLELGDNHADDVGLTKSVASARIGHRITLRTITELIRLQPSKNDAVICRSVLSDYDGVPHEFLRYALVSSVGAGGLVYFKGGNGQCSPPYKLTRAGPDDDPLDYPQGRPLVPGS